MVVLAARKHPQALQYASYLGFGIAHPGPKVGAVFPRPELRSDRETVIDAVSASFKVERGTRQRDMK